MQKLREGFDHVWSEMAQLDVKEFALTQQMEKKENTSINGCAVKLLIHVP
jgi:hypothetical protein